MKTKHSKSLEQTLRFLKHMEDQLGAYHCFEFFLHGGAWYLPLDAVSTTDPEANTSKLEQLTKEIKIDSIGDIYGDLAIVYKAKAKESVPFRLTLHFHAYLN